MVSAHMLEPVDYLDINSVVLLFVVLCYTLLPSCVPVYGFHLGVAPNPYTLYWKAMTMSAQALLAYLLKNKRTQRH